MLFIDVKYINQIAFRLDNFKRKNDYLYNFRCPICGDSKKKKNKARGYLYKVKNDMFFKCHNCGAGKNMGGFLDLVDPQLKKEYVLERYAEGVSGNKSNKEPDFNFTFKEPVSDDILTKFKDITIRVDSLDESHEAVQYLKQRRIPEDAYKRLYFVDEVRKIVAIAPKYEGRLDKEPRIIMPFIIDGKLTGMAMRGIRSEILRYINVKIDEDSPTVFGLDNIDTSKEVYITEGALDSLFINNCIAVVGSTFAKIDELNIKNYTIIFDNEPRNKEICKLIENNINQDRRVVIWPEEIEQKDINDMILADYSSDYIESLISKNALQGLEAKLKFTNWKKC